MNEPQIFHIIWLSNLSNLSVPDEDYSSNVPDEDYSRNASCALNVISRFILLDIMSLIPRRSYLQKSITLFA